jgi:acylphosphatase
MIALRLVVRGRVQGVGFRYAMQDAATMHGVTGWVRNRRDGTVEAFVQGEAPAVDAVFAWCRRGPPAARVDAVESFAATPDPAILDFSHAPTA